MRFREPERAAEGKSKSQPVTGNRTGYDQGGKMTRLVLILNNAAVALERFVWKVAVARRER
jgi:hypothetical protein